jgi:UPF0716 protein FxsA
MIAPLLALLILVPLVEIYVIVQVGQVIGVWWTIVALVAETVLGAWLVRREGRRAWRTLVTELTEGRPPTRAATDGAVILLGGVLLLTPGFVTDFFGFLCVLPPTRPLVRRAVIALVRRLARAVTSSGPARGGPGAVHEVIEGHLVDPDDHDH